MMPFNFSDRERFYSKMFHSRLIIVFLIQENHEILNQSFLCTEKAIRSYFQQLANSSLQIHVKEKISQP